MPDSSCCTASKQILLAAVARLVAAGETFAVTYPDGGKLAKLTVTSERPDLAIDLICDCNEDRGVRFDFDHKEAKGSLTVSPGNWGPNLWVNVGTEAVGFLDLVGKSPSGGGQPPAFVFYDSRYDEVAAKLVYEDGELTLIVNGDMERVADRHPQGVYSDGRDRVYKFTDAETEEETT